MKRLLKALVIVVSLAFLAGCTSTLVTTDPSEFRPQSINLEKYQPKVNKFVVILDASQSMNELHNEQPKFVYAKELASRMAMTIVDGNLTGGLRSFGHGFCEAQVDTQMLYGMSKFMQADFQDALDSIVCAGGNSPLAAAITAAGTEDLSPGSGRVAVIALSDGKQMVGSPAEAVQGLKDSYGDDLCFYAIVIGDDETGAEVLKSAAAAGGCGFAVNGDALQEAGAMADFVAKALMEAAVMDSDGDGVPDNLDKCPDTPKGVGVDERGCPPDTDGDGVGDYMDKCPDTPKGAYVNAVGCWEVANIEFCLDCWRLTPNFFKELDKVAAIMKENPGMKVEIQGHTDNIGPRKYNQKLSEKRAKSVVEYLIYVGIDAGRLSHRGYGLTRPIATNDTPEGRQQNRRVEITPKP